MAAFDPARGGTLTHGSTFNNNVVTMAAGAAALDELLTADVLDRLYARGDALRGRIYYRPTERGAERELAARLASWRRWRDEQRRK